MKIYIIFIILFFSSVIYADGQNLPRLVNDIVTNVKEKNEAVHKVLEQLSEAQAEEAILQNKVKIQRRVSEEAKKAYERDTHEEIVQMVNAKLTSVRAEQALQKVIKAQENLRNFEKMLFEAKIKNNALAQNYIEVENDLLNAQIEFISKNNDAALMECKNIDQEGNMMEEIKQNYFQYPPYMDENSGITILQNSQNSFADNSFRQFKNITDKLHPAILPSVSSNYSTMDKIPLSPSKFSLQNKKPILQRLIDLKMNPPPVTKLNTIDNLMWKPAFNISALNFEKYIRNKPAYSNTQIKYLSNESPIIIPEGIDMNYNKTSNTSADTTTNNINNEETHDSPNHFISIVLEEEKSSPASSISKNPDVGIINKYLQKQQIINKNDELYGFNQKRNNFPYNFNKQFDVRDVLNDLKNRKYITWN